MNTADIYRTISAWLPQHAGSAVGASAVPATLLTDPEWLRADLHTAARMYGHADRRVLGTIRWYSLSSVLVAPPIESSVLAGRALDPSLEAVMLDVLPDGRVAGALSTRVLGGGVTELGAALADALGAAVKAIGAVTGASLPSLWAIAGDSISNRLLWAGTAAGKVDDAIELAESLAVAIGSRLPKPRFVRVGSTPAVRRASCCLIYEATGGDKCTSCPRQTPAERTRRLHAALG